MSADQSATSKAALQIHFKCKPNKISAAIDKEISLLRAKLTELNEIRSHFIVRFKSENAHLAQEKEEALRNLSRRESDLFGQLYALMQRHQDSIIERKNVSDAEYQAQQRILDGQLVALCELGLVIPKVDNERLIADLKQQLAKLKKNSTHEKVSAAIECIQGLHVTMTALTSRFVCLNRQIMAFKNFDLKTCTVKQIDVYACQIRENNQGVNPQGYEELREELGRVDDERMALESGRASSPLSARIAAFEDCIRLLETPAQPTNAHVANDNRMNFKA